MKQLLIVDDEADIRDVLSDILADEGYQVHQANNGASAKAQFAKQAFDLVLLDIWMPDIDGISVLSKLMQTETPPTVVMMSGHGTIETAIEATRLGAYDFLEKPISMAKLLLTVQNALAHSELQQENVQLKKSQHTQIIGNSQAMNQLRAQATQMAQSDLPVLITGEAGTEKNLLAKYIHQQQGSGPFVPLPASTIGLVDTAHELFGGVLNGIEKVGRFSQAEGGTLFISQIEEMDHNAQAVLMAALEHGTFSPLQSEAVTPIRCRLIASASQDIPNLISEKVFREDLYYQLNVLSIHTPALREHSEDIQELLKHHTDLTIAAYGLNYRHFSVAAQNFLRQYSWPGNITELVNLVRRLLVLGGDVEISKEEAETCLNPEVASNEVLGDQALYQLELKEARHAFEKSYLLHHLQQNSQNVSQTAQKIGIERANIYRKLRLHNIDPRKV